MILRLVLLSMFRRFQRLELHATLLCSCEGSADLARSESSIETPGSVAISTDPRVHVVILAEICRVQYKIWSFSCAVTK